jgi:hypothetical protein
VTALLACLVVAQDFDAKAELLAALEKLSGAASYSYKSKVEYASQGYFGAGQDWQGPIEAEGKVDAKAGVVGTSNGVKFARRGSRLVVADGIGGWAPPKGGRFPTVVEMRTKAGPGLDAPHKAFAEFGDKVKSAAAADDTERVADAECVVLKVELTEKAAEAILKEASATPVPDAGALGPVLRLSGRARFWIDDEGRLRKAETVVEAALQLGATRASMTRTQVTEFSGHGETAVELPARAEQALKGSP